MSKTRTGVAARLDALEAAHKAATDHVGGTLYDAVPDLIAAVRGVVALADEWDSAAELYDACALDAQARFDLMAEGGHLIQAGDARRFADRLRATVTAALGEA